MSNDTQITESSYDIPSKLQSAVQEGRITVEYDDEREYEVMGQPAKQVELRVIDTETETEIRVTETTSVVGHMASAQGDIGLSAVYHCSLAQQLGVPTLLYTDERITMGGLDERYHDLSAEWFPKEAQDSGIVQSRKEQHGERYESVEMALTDMESLALQYIEA